MNLTELLRELQESPKSRAADDFVVIRRRLAELEASRQGAGTDHANEPDVYAFDVVCRQPATPLNLRELIEGGDQRWPEEVITDGADHFVIPRGGHARR